MGSNQETYDAVHGSRARIGCRIDEEHDPGTGRRLHRRADSHITAGIGRARPGLRYTQVARGHIAALRRARSLIAIKISWEETASKKKADGLAKLAAAEADTHGAEWLD